LNKAFFEANKLEKPTPQKYLWSTFELQNKVSFHSFTILEICALVLTYVIMFIIRVSKQANLASIVLDWFVVNLIINPLMVALFSF
jgi:hypothetical protein